jgi:hypothetical protein
MKEGDSGDGPYASPQAHQATLPRFHDHWPSEWTVRFVAVEDPNELETLLQALRINAEQLLAEVRDPSTTPARKEQVKDEARRILRVLEQLLQKR